MSEVIHPTPNNQDPKPTVAENKNALRAVLRPGGRLIAKCASKNATGGPGSCYSHPGFIFAPPEGSLPLIGLSRDKVRQAFAGNICQGKEDVYDGGQALT
jgi:hypothetical protein